MKTINLKWLWLVVYFLLTLALVMGATVAFGQTPGAAPVEDSSLELSKLSPMVLVVGSIFGLVLTLILVYIIFILADFMPAAKQTYEQPELANSTVGKVVGLFTGDTTTLTGKYADVVISKRSSTGSPAKAWSPGKAS